MTPLRREFLLLAALAAGAALAGWVTGAWGWCAFTALALWVIRHVLEFQRLTRWSRRQLSRPDPHSALWRRATVPAYRSIQRNRRRARFLLEQVNKLRVTTEALPDAAILVDRRGIIESHNPAARRLLNLRSSAREQSLPSLLRHPALASLLRGEIAENIIEIPAPLLEERMLEIRRVAVSKDRSLILARDVTELNRLLTMRQDFIANVSHELRTPLTVVLGYLESLEDPELERELARQLVAKLRSPTERMKALVDDLLLLTRLESSPVPPRSEMDQINPGRLLDQIVAEARELSGGAHRFIVEVDPEIPLVGLQQELHSAFGNLVNNAVRYSPNGGEIRVTWHRHGDHGRFAVEDEGVGIPEEHLSRITERFYRVDLAKARVRGGTGLGLAIAKHVLKRHGASLEVRSQLGKGSLFYCDFSLQPSAQDTELAAAGNPR